LYKYDISEINFVFVFKWTGYEEMKNVGALGRGKEST
jgi:hypothetical protein